MFNEVCNFKYYYRGSYFFSSNIGAVRMKGRTPTAAEGRYMTKIKNLGCIACSNMEIETPPEYTLIHHTDGKTKPNAHYRSIPLCDPHHSPLLKTGLHANKTVWEEEHGTEEELLNQVWEFVSFEGYPDE